MSDLVERLRGRARFLRDRKRIKSPELMEDAAARITELETALAEAEGRVKAITIAMHDAIRRPMGVVPASADPFYQPALASDPLLDRQGNGKDGLGGNHALRGAALLDQAQTVRRRSTRFAAVALDRHKGGEGLGVPGRAALPISSPCHSQPEPKPYTTGSSSSLKAGRPLKARS